MQVGFIGLGRMGTGMARNLMRAGHEVTVWNRTASGADPLVAEGARRAGAPIEAAHAEVVISMLADDGALETATLGEHGLVHGSASTYVVMGTHGLALVERLAAAYADTGKAYVAAPVLGRPEAAEAAKLFILAAGPADAIERCGPLFEAMGQRTFNLGPRQTAANLVKLCGNFLLAAVIEGLAEAMALGRKGGVEPGDLLEVLTSTAFTAPIYKSYGGLMVEEKFTPPGFTMPLGLKDVRLALAAGDALGVPLPMASTLRDCLLTGLGRGMGDLDWSALARLAAENAGVK